MKIWTTNEDTIKFELDKVESENYRNFEKACENATEGCIELTFHPTGIGMHIEARHTGLGVKANLTNYDNW